MTDKEKLIAINWICLSHIGDKHSMTRRIQEVIRTKKKRNINPPKSSNV